jgi:predicted dehydrogenase
MPDSSKLSFLICGLGSIGQRHTKNLISLGEENIVICRSGKGMLSTQEFKKYPMESDINRALKYSPTAVIISNPTSLHVDTATQAVKAGCHLFIEKPISHSLAGVDKLCQLVEEKQVDVLVGFQFRFHPAMLQIKKWLEEKRIGRLVSVHVHWGEYLPDWHPWEDYRKGYSARKELGGGVVLTLCHPFDYLRWLIGEIVSVSANVNKLSGLEIDVEDTASILLRFPNGCIGSVYLDYIQRPSQHTLQCIGREGQISWNNKDGIAELYENENNRVERFAPPENFTRNTLFKNEMAHFLDMLENNKSSCCTFQDGVQALKIALAVKQSSIEKKEVYLD